jgi:ribosomal protein S18 acetylase RimI-like enzyme
VEVLQRDHEESAARALVASHSDYPAFRHVFPDSLRRQRALFPFFLATVHDAVPFGAVYGALKGQEVLGVAVWLPPGAFPWSLGRKIRVVPTLLRVFAAYPRGFGTFVAYGANAEREHPSDPHWYLEVLGIRPEVQRTGLGTLLMAPVLELADREGLSVVLETSDPDNVNYYRRFGFVVESEAVQLVPGGPPHVSMARRPSHQAPSEGNKPGKA